MNKKNTKKHKKHKKTQKTQKNEESSNEKRISVSKKTNSHVNDSQNPHKSFVFFSLKWNKIIVSTILICFNVNGKNIINEKWKKINKKIWIKY